MIILSKEQIIALHSHLIAETGGIDGLRDEGLLESALNAPFQAFGDMEAYPSIQQKAARHVILMNFLIGFLTIKCKVSNI